MSTDKLQKNNATARRTEWWHDFFPVFRPVFSIVSQKTTNAQVGYIAKKLGLKPGRKFLDCPCGIGRISIPLARKGIWVTGVDITQSYLDELAQKAKRLRLKIDVVYADMRRINFDSEFDAAGNLWTSFGYFEKESDNLLALKKMFRALKPGGKFLLHLMNRDWIIKHYTPNAWYKAGDQLVLEERRFDYDRSTNICTWRFMKDGQESVHTFGLRLYSCHELLAMMQKIGFIDTAAYGSMDDDPVTSGSQMMFLIGTKPGK